MALNGPNQTKTGVTRRQKERFGWAQFLNGATNVPLPKIDVPLIAKDFWFQKTLTFGLKPCFKVIKRKKKKTQEVAVI